MSAGAFTFNVANNAGSHFRLTWLDSNGSPVNLSGYGAVMDVIRDGATDPALELSTANGKLSITGVAGTIDILFELSDLASLNGSYLYDLLLTKSPNDPIRLIAGQVNVAQGQTSP